MDFEWNEQKSEQNLSERGFGFETILPVFADPHRVTFRDERREYGEERLTSFGEIEGRVFAVTFTFRGDAIRIISARKANKKERIRYADCKTND